jgi:hypothetical protein
MRATEAPHLDITASRSFTSRLAAQRVSFVITTYRTGKRYFIGLEAKGRMAVDRWWIREEWIRDRESVIADP